MFNSINGQRFKEIYDIYEAGNYSKALEGLRDLEKGVVDPWGKAELLYYEVRFLAEMRDAPEAKRRALELNSLVSSLVEEPSDGHAYTAEASLPVMARHALLKATIAEAKPREALRLLDDLLADYPKQLSLPEFQNVLQEVQALRGFLLADQGRWEDAKPFLETASPPDAWRRYHRYYLGKAYYECREYEHAKEKLLEAIHLGLERSWESQGHYLLGVIEHKLSHTAAAKREFELCARTADEKFIETTNLWAWLETTSRSLGLLAEAEHYKQMMGNSVSRKVN